MSDQEQLERIREIVEDENRIVTYKLLSKELRISVNDAKSVLHKFVKDGKAKKCDDFVVCYCVSGLKNLNLGDCERQINVVCVVPDKKLEKLKSSLKVVSSEHVYSVQKTAQNSCSLYATDLDARDERHLSSAVKCEKVKPRKGHPKNVTADTAVNDNSGPSKNATGQSNHKILKNEPRKEKSADGNDASDGVDKEVVAIKSGERNAFTTKTNKPKSNSKDTNAKGMLANMFANQASKEKPTKHQKEKENVKELATETNNQTKNEQKSKHHEIAKKVKPDSENKAAPQPKVSTNKKPTTRGRKNVRSKSKTKADEAPPKRRRILVSDSSSSESEEEEEDPLAKMELDEPEDPIPSPVRSPSPDSRKSSRTKESQEMDVEEPEPDNTPGIVRQKKLVSKTFLDEDGYLVTKKVTEIEEVVEAPLPVVSRNGDENDKSTQNNHHNSKNSVAAKKSTANTKSKKPSPPKNSKQASLMSFFKKA